MSDSPRTYTQTKISSYFRFDRGGSTQSQFVCPPIKQERKRRTTRTSKMANGEKKGKSLLKTPVWKESPHRFEKRKLVAKIFSDDEDSSECDENDKSVCNGRSKRVVQPVQHKESRASDTSLSKDKPVTMISLNKPSPIKTTPRKSPLKWIPQTVTTRSQDLPSTSAPTSDKPKNSQSSTNVTPTPQNSQSSAVNSEVRKHARVLFPSENSDCNANISKSQSQIKVLSNIVVSPPKKAKTEGKKLNFNYLNSMRIFFLNVLEHEQLRCLISDHQRDMLFKFYTMDKIYQFICIKLFMWKPGWYNVFKYIEKLNIEMGTNEAIMMYNYLKENNFVDTNYEDEDLITLLNLLSIKQLREINKSFKFNNTHTNRDSVINKLLSNCKTQVTLTRVKSTESVLRERIREKMGYCFKLNSDLINALYNVYLLNTFTNPGFVRPQDYFRDTNIVYPDYKTEKYHIFYTKEEFLKYANAMQLRIAYEEAVEKKEVSQIFEICQIAYSSLKELNEESDSFDKNRLPHLEKFTANAQYISILSSAIKSVTSTAYDEAKVWLEYLISQNYCKHKRGYWYCQLALIYSNYLKNYEAAAKLLISALKNEKENLSEIQAQDLAHRGRLLDKKSYRLSQFFHDELAAFSPPPCDYNGPHVVVESRTMRGNKQGQKRKYLQQCENGDTNYLTVEQTALEHYKSAGYSDGIHCEGGLICASFCLLFRDIIFETYVEGTFVSAMQTAPLDMYTKYFYEKRSNAVDTRISDISINWSDETLKSFLVDKWTRHSHESTLYPVENAIQDPAVLFNIITCMGRAIFAKIMERLAKNYRVTHSGFPDLTVWNITDKKVKFVEVKGEGDSLAINQKLWLNYLLQIGADAEVAFVHSTGSKRKIIKKNSES